MSWRRYSAQQTPTVLTNAANLHSGRALQHQLPSSACTSASPCNQKHHRPLWKSLRQQWVSEDNTLKGPKQKWKRVGKRWRQRWWWMRTIDLSSLLFSNPSRYISSSNHLTRPSIGLEMARAMLTERKVALRWLNPVVNTCRESLCSYASKCTYVASVL